MAGLVVLSVILATDALGHQDVGGLSDLDPHMGQMISILTMPKDVGMPL